LEPVDFEKEWIDTTTKRFDNLDESIKCLDTKVGIYMTESHPLVHEKFQSKIDEINKKLWMTSGGLIVIMTLIGWIVKFM
jgi:hypothetical protein